jgi:hypothetical protein
VVNAHRINAGQPPAFGKYPDFFLFPADEPEATAERVVDLVARRIPRRFGISPRDIQVLRGAAFASRYVEKCNDQVIVCEDRMPTPEGVGSSSVMGRPAWADATEPRLANLEAGLCLSHGRGGRRLVRVATAPNFAVKIARRRTAR